MCNFKVLGLTPSASKKEIKAAYRKLAMRLHPDRTGGSKESEARFKEINKAYQASSSRASSGRQEDRPAAHKGHAATGQGRHSKEKTARSGASKQASDFSAFHQGARAIHRRFDEVNVEIWKAKESFERFDEIMRSMAAKERRRAENRTQDLHPKAPGRSGTNWQEFEGKVKNDLEIENSHINKTYANNAKTIAILDAGQGAPAPSASSRPFHFFQEA